MYKKLFLVLSFVLFSVNAHAGIISQNTISADSTVNTFNSNFTTVTNVINGNIEGSSDGGSTVSNIKADSVFEINMADDANGRVRDSELLGITVDTTTSQATYVYSGGIPADSANLTSDISACVAYINGYRVSKGTTSKTYTASKDTYVDLSQTGVYTYSEVTVGAAAPAVAANSARLSKVTTDGTEITAVTDLANRRLIGVLIPSNFRSGMIVSRDSTTTITVFPGSVEVDDSIVSKSTTTTLTVSTAGDWAGGSSLRATSTYGYVGIDASGNLKMHTTAPTHQNYDVTITAGKKRYATWSGTVYRIIGWFYMNATGSGELNTYEVGNIREGDAPNAVNAFLDTEITSTATTSSDMTGMTIHFYSSGNPITVSGMAKQIHGTNTVSIYNSISCDSTFVPGTLFMNRVVSNAYADGLYVYGNTNSARAVYNIGQGTHTFQTRWHNQNGATAYTSDRAISVAEN